jgi:hypothetical protein
MLYIYIHMYIYTYPDLTLPNIGNEETRLLAPRIIKHGRFNKPQTAFHPAEWWFFNLDTHREEGVPPFKGKNHTWRIQIFYSAQWMEQFLLSLMSDRTRLVLVESDISQGFGLLTEILIPIGCISALWKTSHFRWLHLLFLSLYDIYVTWLKHIITHFGGSFLLSGSSWSNPSLVYHLSWFLNLELLLLKPLGPAAVWMFNVLEP